MIHLRHLRLRSITQGQVYGLDIPLKMGLNIIQAHNTSGKSTTLQAVVYALGLERSLGPQLTIPLPYSMRERIHRHADDPYESVLQSYVELEIGNDNGRTLIIKRDVVGGKDKKLIRTWARGSLSKDIDRSDQRDFFVHDGGAAQHEDGFHAFLSEFIGWELPNVPRFDGSESLLYLETIFPMFFVEQKRGWSAIQGPFPTFMKIQDIARRVLEFLLDLDSGKIRRRRLEIRAAISSVKQRWAERRQSLEQQAEHIGRVRGVPSQPSKDFVLSPEIKFEIFRQDEWLSIAAVLEGSRSRIRSLESCELKTTEESVPELQQRLESVRRESDELSAQLEAIHADVSTESQEQEALRLRLESLAVDLRRNKDALKLTRLGSDLGRAAGEHVCPTCHQDIASELLPAVENAGMGLEENISFVQSQIDLYRASLQNATSRVRDCQARHRSKREELRERQAELRGLRQAIVQPSSVPSRVVIEEIVRLQAFVDRIVSLEEAAVIISDELQELAKEWSQLQEALSRLPLDELTIEDKRKITSLENSVQMQLTEYEFKSFQPKEISLSRDNFRPIAVTPEDEGEVIEKEIAFEISASDAIRLKWAYYLALLRLSTIKRTNHCGVVIFDEPGQQEVEITSLYTFLSNAAECRASSQQVIVSTSVPLGPLRSALAPKAHIVSFDGFMLQPISS